MRLGTVRTFCALGRGFGFSPKGIEKLLDGFVGQSGRVCACLATVWGVGCRVQEDKGRLGWIRVTALRRVRLRCRMSVEDAVWVRMPG